VSAIAFLFLQSSTRASYEAIEAEHSRPVGLAVDLDASVEGNDTV
jgi:hypothetical protein